MKRFLCAFVVLMLICQPVLAETTVQPTAEPTAESTPRIIIELATPTPVPDGETFSNEDLIITFPYGMHALDEEARVGFDAALQASYPDAARTIVAAADEAMQKSLVAAVITSDMEALSAAKEAAEAILGTSESVQELTLGENSYASFACAIGAYNYYLYCLSDGEELLLVGVSGLNQAETEYMLTGLKF